ncbi:Nucleic-acid-binding protein from transposon X-element [Eumeta japonica]|uniref:ATP-dependent DNA helicase n=1 Tax=Eumeta variegata TaxID=151549 RepID=A0A4C1YT29_EUMVA|nr:Nucleic-acid-binding protein from transposon X-element [Eumeta japonica]
MERNLHNFLKERGHLDLLREFEEYCASPASPDPHPHPQVVVFDPEMDVEFTLPREPKKRPATVRPSEGTTSDSDSSDISDHSEFTTVRRRKASKASERKPEASYLTQASDGSTYYRITPSSKKPKKANIAEATASTKTRSIYDSPVSWRTPSQPTTASQGAVEAGKTKAAAPAAAKNSISDEADVTAPPTPAQRGPKPPPMFVQNKDRWTELRKKCADKNIQISQARNSAQGLKLQAKSIADFRNLQNLLVSMKISFHTYSLKEEREIRVVLRGVPKEIPVDEVKEDLLSQNLPVQSVRRLLNRYREPLDLVLVSGTAEANDKATKAAFFKISVCSLSGVKAEQPRKRALPGQCHNCQSYGHSRSTRLCPMQTKGHTANYLGCPRAPKEPHRPRGRAVARPRAVSATLSYAGGRTAQRPARRKKYLNIRSRRSEPADVVSNERAVKVARSHGATTENILIGKLGKPPAARATRDGRAPRAASERGIRFYTSVSSIRTHTKDAQLLRESDLIIWDEVSMAPKDALRIVDRLLKDIMNNNLPFGATKCALRGTLPAVKQFDDRGQDFNRLSIRRQYRDAQQPPLSSIFGGVQDVYRTQGPPRPLRRRRAKRTRTGNLSILLVVKPAQRKVTPGLRSQQHSSPQRALFSTGGGGRRGGHSMFFAVPAFTLVASGRPAELSKASRCYSALSSREIKSCNAGRRLELAVGFDRAE